MGACDDGRSALLRVSAAVAVCGLLHAKSCVHVATCPLPLQPALGVCGGLPHCRQQARAKSAFSRVRACDTKMVNTLRMTAFVASCCLGGCCAESLQGAAC